MKNNFMKISGVMLGMIAFCFTLTSTNFDEAQAQDLSIEPAGDLYEPGVCYNNGVWKAVCITPAKLGPCSRKVECQ